MILWGARTGLKPFAEPLTDTQAARVYKWSRDPELLRWSSGTPTDLSFEEFHARLREESHNDSKQRYVFYIVTRPDELIGRIGVFAIDWTRRDGELGIVIGESEQWGRGYGRDAITTLLHHLFATTPLERVYLFTYPENTRAQRCFAACGFRHIGTALRFSPDLGEYVGVEMEITRHEFLSQPTRGNIGLDQLGTALNLPRI